MATESKEGAERKGGENQPSGKDSKEMVKEAVRSATMSPPTGNTLATMDGRGRVMEMAQSGAAMDAGMVTGGVGIDVSFGGYESERETEREREGGSSPAALVTYDTNGGEEPDWGNNPDDLDSPRDVREEFEDSGLNPMNVDSQEEAQFGHMLVHAFANDGDLGGRSAAELEAEHDMTVAALDDFGVETDSPLDFANGGLSLPGSDEAFSFFGGDD